MATDPARVEPGLRGVQVAVLAKAPVAGLAKTRLIPALGPVGAARLQRRFTQAAVQCALEAGLGPVTLWCTPTLSHSFFRALARVSIPQPGRLRFREQPEGDLGARMLAAFHAHCPAGPLLLMGTDCPALTPDHLQRAARHLADGDDGVVVPAEDGGYVLIGLRTPQPVLFDAMAWSTPQVLSDTRGRARAASLRLRELPGLWDVDVPEDLPRLRAWEAASSGRTGGGHG